MYPPAMIKVGTVIIETRPNLWPTSEANAYVWGSDAKLLSGDKIPIHKATAAKWKVKTTLSIVVSWPEICPIWLKDHIARIPPSNDTQSPTRPINNLVINSPRQARWYIKAVPTNMFHINLSISWSIIPRVSPVRFAPCKENAMIAAKNPRTPNFNANRRVWLN